MSLADNTGYGRRMGRTDTSSIMIPAPREQVYAALLDPWALEMWLPPDGMAGRVLEFDPRPGGTFRMELTYLDGSRGKSSEHSDITEVTFVELVPAKRVVQRVVFESDDPSVAGAMTMIWLLGETKGGTSVEIRAEDVPPGISPEDHARGLAASLSNLANYLAGQHPGG
jgi:uncharacterized protein YndB with AHSA1/START domain